MGGGAGGPAGDPFGNPFDIFEQFFGGGSGFGGFGGGGGRQRSQPRQGEDMRYDLQLEFNEAIFGTRCAGPCPAWLARCSLACLSLQARMPKK